ncbi:serine hydrolase [Geomicrobium sp. JCM 19039]|uniref:serine hydrolase domain-containing protein n=1 Tax=Geomicrobium sp. JCM 19039 TaxID=1460636 RepID=UPI000A9C69DD|nr:beta-lactamase family protein [Geomicrobium sp. JCM 19039]
MDASAYESFANTIIDTHKTPGVIVAIKDRYEKGFGYRDAANKLPVTEETVFGIGSITKSMTCIAILQLEERGELDVQDKVTTHIPELSFPGSEQITIHHLMTHTSGIPPLNTLFYANKKSMEADGSFDLQMKMGVPLDANQKSIETYDDLIDYLNTTSFTMLETPGTVFSYSNDGYALLGIIIERVSGQVYADYMEEYLFSPLEMNTTFFNPKYLNEHTATLLYSADPTADNPEIEASPGWWDAYSMWSAGYVKSTARDMIRYGEFFLEPYQGLLSPERIQAMCTPHIQIEPGIYYGYGVVITPDFFGTTRIDHGGGIKGVSAHFAVLPDKAMSAVCLTNIAGAPAEVLLNGAVQSELGIEPEAQAIQYPDIRLHTRTGKRSSVRTSRTKVKSSTPTRKTITYTLRFKTMNLKLVPLAHAH